MLIGNINGEYKELLVAPNSFKTRILALIDEEMKKGSAGEIAMKINSVSDIDIIRKLRDASRAGVRIKMIIRGICCILPNVAGHTENITVISIVGRFLEHSRIYSFGSGVDQKFYISSADFMTRNTQRRVEIACPIYDAEIRKRINEMLSVMWADNMKARILTKNNTYVKKIYNIEEAIDSQQYFMSQVIRREFSRSVPHSFTKGFCRTLRSLFSKEGSGRKRVERERAYPASQAEEEAAATGDVSGRSLTGQKKP